MLRTRRAVSDVITGKLITNDGEKVLPGREYARSMAESIIDFLLDETNLKLVDLPRDDIPRPDVLSLAKHLLGSK